MTYLKPIYLDYQSTTPVDPRVLEVMLPYFTEHFGNPHSRTHSYGWSAEAAVEQARQKVANVLGADPREIIFTSGATEANNLAIKGLAAFHQKRPIHIITTVTEHKCVLDACRHLSEAGVEITYLPVQPNGILDLNDLQEAFREHTILVSVMAVNNEIGVIQPIETIGAMCRERGVLFHCDAAQGFGKIPLDVERMCIDLLSISGHKIYGPKGIGALYVRRKPRVRLTPLMNGGGQERGLRSGTIPTPLVVGLGEAAALSYANMEAERRMLKGYFDNFVGRIQQAIPDVYLNGDAVQRWPGNVNLSFAYVEGESMLMAIKALAVSSGSACTSASLEPSYVLRALGVREELAHTSIRFGFGRFTTQEEIDQSVELILRNVERLRQMSPLWEMVQDGIDLTTIQWSGH